MKNLKWPISMLLILILSGFIYQNTNQHTDIRNFKKYYDHYNLQGSFTLYDQKNDKFIFYNQQQFRQQFSPASTFKICNSLIGLETGVIKDENFIIPWKGKIYQNPKWNYDQDLKTAYKNSTVWYYQELAKRVGIQQMKSWLDIVHYGNADTTGGIEHFWLRGGLRITPEEQIEFLKKLHDNNLKFSKRTIDIVKRIMIAKDTLDYVIRAKTGWADEPERIVGWYIGYIEKNNNVYYFVNCIQSNNPDHADFAKARIDITYHILNELKLTKE